MSAGLIDAFAGEVTAVALCWRLTRSDGVMLGFTSHDSDLLIDGLEYRARPGMTPSAISQGASLRADSMEVDGALVSSAISAFDLEAGKWTGAQIELLACDWSRPDLGMMPLMCGELGEISRPYLHSTGSFRAELLSDLVRLERAGPFRIAPMCRAELGDGRCGVNMDGRRIECVVGGGARDRLILDASIANSERFFRGRMRFVTGPLTGVDRRVAALDVTELLLEEEVPAGVIAGSRIWLWEGCDKRLATCSERFGNAAAFDGEPHVPGMDALVRYAEG